MTDSVPVRTQTSGKQTCAHRHVTPTSTSLYGENGLVLYTTIFLQAIGPCRAY